MTVGSDPISANAVERLGAALTDPLDQLEFLIRDPMREVVMDLHRHDGEILLITRTRGETRASRTYTGVRLRDAIRNLWEHEQP